MRVLVTGVNGFLGTALTEALRAEGHSVYGLSSTSGGHGPGDTFLQVNVADQDSVAQAVTAVQPDSVFHLAAQSDIQRSFTDPKETIEVNLLGSLHLLDAVRTVTPRATVVSVGSSAEYGRGAGTLDRIQEDTPLLPNSPYGVSKAAQGMLALLYARAYGMRVVHVRPFAVIGPGKRGNAVADMCQAISLVEQGDDQPVTVGDPETVRDFIDVRDCVRAFLLVATAGKAGESYNICNGIGVRLGEVLDLLQACATVPFRQGVGPHRPRPADDRRLVGDPTRLEALGYHPQVPLADTLRTTLAYWRAHTVPVSRTAADAAAPTPAHRQQP